MTENTLPVVVRFEEIDGITYKCYNLMDGTYSCLSILETDDDSIVVAETKAKTSKAAFDRCVKATIKKAEAKQ